MTVLRCFGVAMVISRLRLCHVIVLCSLGVATVISRLGLPHVTVAVDGSLYRFHPHFKDLMHKKITQLCGPQQQVINTDGCIQMKDLASAFSDQNSFYVEIFSNKIFFILVYRLLFV